jgi:hypothetical protein
VEDTDQECSTNGGYKKYIVVKRRGKFKCAFSRYSYEGKIVVCLKLIDYIYNIYAGPSGRAV